MSTPDVDLRSFDFLNDPYPSYKKLREANKPYWFAFNNSGGMWMFTHYQQVADILKETNMTKDTARLFPDEATGPFDNSMLFKDPPDHTRMRSLANQAFTPKRIREMEPRIRKVVDDLIAKARPNGGMNFISEFALPLPVIVIAELLGVPAEDREEFHTWSSHLIVSGDAFQQNEATAKNAQMAAQSLGMYFANLIKQRRLSPKEDLISDLILATESGDKLNDEELLAMCVLLLVAGHETTVNLIGTGLYSLLKNKDQFELLKSDLDLMPSAIEEMLRYESPVQRATSRFTTKDLEIGETVIKAGQQISAVIGAANRDPDQFPEPDTFDITRHPNRHLAFGLGIHFCLGAPLARTEARIGFTRLLEQLPNIKLTDERLVWRGSTMFRGLEKLSVVF